MPDISRMDVIANTMTRLIVDDGDIQGHIHTICVTELELPWTFGANDEDEQHPKYDHYWEMYNAVMVTCLGRVIGSLRHWHNDGGDVAV